MVCRTRLGFMLELPQPGVINPVTARSNAVKTMAHFFTDDLPGTATLAEVAPSESKNTGEANKLLGNVPTSPFGHRRRLLCLVQCGLRVQYGQSVFCYPSRTLVQPATSEGATTLCNN